MLFYERKLLQYWKVFFRVQKISFHEILLIFLFLLLANSDDLGTTVCFLKIHTRLILAEI